MENQARIDYHQHAKDAAEWINDEYHKNLLKPLTTKEKIEEKKQFPREKDAESIETHDDISQKKDRDIFTKKPRIFGI